MCYELNNYLAAKIEIGMKQFIRKILQRFNYDIVKVGGLSAKPIPADFDEFHKKVLRNVGAETMTSPERIFSLIEAVNILGSLFYGVILGVFLVAFFFKQIKNSNAVFWAAVFAEFVVLLVFIIAKKRLGATQYWSRQRQRAWLGAGAGW